MISGESTCEPELARALRRAPGFAQAANSNGLRVQLMRPSVASRQAVLGPRNQRLHFCDQHLLRRMRSSVPMGLQYPESRRIMLGIADDYDKLAKRAQERLRRGEPTRPMSRTDGGRAVSFRAPQSRAGNAAAEVLAPA